MKKLSSEKPFDSVVTVTLSHNSSYENNGHSGFMSSLLAVNIIEFDEGSSST